MEKTEKNSSSSSGGSNKNKKMQSRKNKDYWTLSKTVFHLFGWIGGAQREGREGAGGIYMGEKKIELKSKKLSITRQRWRKIENGSEKDGIVCLRSATNAPST